MDSFFSSLPVWQLLIFVVVISVAVAGATMQLYAGHVRQEARTHAAAEVYALGRELVRCGYLMRGELVKAAAATVKALADSRRLPWFPRRGHVPESPVQRYIRELRSPDVELAKLLVTPKPRAKGPLHVIPWLHRYKRAGSGGGGLSLGTTSGVA